MGRKIALSVFGILIICALAGLLYRGGFIQINNPSVMDFPVRGLDVSHHQGTINWQDVPKEKFRFVYIKATEGGDFKDPNFKENWGSALANNFKVGAYHFFTLCKSGKEQAENFIKTVPVIDGALAPAIDLEFVGNCKNRPVQAYFIKEFAVFVQILEDHYGLRPIIYTTYEFYNAYLKEPEYQRYKFWVRDIIGRPDPAIFPKWYIWQYADNLRVDGISEVVDGNVMSTLNFTDID